MFVAINRFKTLADWGMHWTLNMHWSLNNWDTRLSKPVLGKQNTTSEDLRVKKLGEVAVLPTI